MTMRRVSLALTGLLVSTAAASAQNAPPSVPPAAPIVAPAVVATTAAACMKGANDWLSPTWQKTAAKTAETYAKIQSEARRAAKECGSKLDLTRTPEAELTSLVSYYAYVGDTAQSRITLDRALAVENLPPRARGTALLLGLEREISRAAGKFAIIDGAEAYVARIDALPDSLNTLKISAHQRMLGQYEYLDVADGLTSHSTALIELGRAAGNKGVMIGAFTSLARASADKLHPEDALRILADAEKEIGTAYVKGAFDDFRHRYALIGTKAETVTGKWWVNNTSPIDAVVPGNGKVTLVEFTAHWCGPCKNSYPGIKQVAEHFRGQPFQGVMVTGLYGYLGDQKNLTPPQEVEADRTYFGTEHAVPFPVAINENLPVSTPRKPNEFPQPKPDRDYRVGGIPQIVIIDKQGVIRQIVIGWDHGNTERFTKYIQQLLAEGVTQ